MSTKTLPATDAISRTSDVKRRVVLPFSDIFRWKTRYNGILKEIVLGLFALITLLKEAVSITLEDLCLARVTVCCVSGKSFAAITLSESFNISQPQATNNSGLITVPDLTILVDTMNVLAARSRYTETLLIKSFSSRLLGRRFTVDDRHAVVKATSSDTNLFHKVFRRTAINFINEFNRKYETICVKSCAVDNILSTGKANEVLSVNVQVVVYELHNSTTTRSRWQSSTSCALSRSSRRRRLSCLFSGEVLTVKRLH